MSSTKFTPLSSSADDSFKATMPAALKESIFRTILNYIMLPSPLILIVGLFFKVRPLTRPTQNSFACKSCEPLILAYATCASSFLSFPKSAAIK